MIVDDEDLEKLEDFGFKKIIIMIMIFIIILLKK